MLGLKVKMHYLRSQLVLLRLKSGVFNVSYLYYLIELSKVQVFKNLQPIMRIWYFHT
jgi:hypothetical protein